MQTLRRFGAFFICASLSVSLLSVPSAKAEDVMRAMVFPALGTVSYGNDFGDARSGGRSHEGNDIMGAKHRPLVAVVDGTIQWVKYPQPEWGYAVSIRDAEGWQYWYLHMNNDAPGTDDGLGDGLHAYAPDIVNGAKVVKGQLIGWMGDSGNAEGTTSHLHFEMHSPEGTVMNPYFSLKAATKISTPVPAPQQSYEMLPYGEFKGGASIATGRFGLGSIVTGAGPGGGPLVRVLTTDGNGVSQFFPYPQAFKGGVNVATGDIDGNGIDEIITGAGSGGGPHVRILDSNGAPRGQFFPYPAGFRGGVNVAAGDLDGDGKAEIITGAGPGGSPHVRVFKADGTPIASFFPYAKEFKGGVYVAVKPASNGSPARIITSPGAGGGPHVRLFDYLGNPDVSFFAYDASFNGGVTLSVMNPTSDDYSIVTTPASKGGPDIRIFSALGQLKESRSAYEPWWRGGYRTATNGSSVYIVGDGRRASIRTVSGSFNNGSNWWENGGTGSNNSTEGTTCRRRWCRGD